MEIRLYKEGSNIVMKDHITGLVLYSVPTKTWRMETKTIGTNYAIRFFNELSRLYAMNGRSFLVTDLKNYEGNNYVTPVDVNNVTIAEINLLHTRLNFFMNTEGYLNIANNYHYLSTAGNNEIVIKAAPSLCLGWNLSNTTGQYRYVKIHDSATPPTQGTTTVKATIALPPNTSQTYFLENGIYLATGLAITASTQAQNNATNDVNVNDIVGEIYYT
jgi:hypothetical protein